jgi:hypothetical protein
MRVRLFALDEEFRPGQDEATVRPWEGALPFDPGEGLNAHGSAACRDDGIVQQAIKITKHVAPEVLVITDLCFCEYTDHGQCVRRVCDGQGRRRHRLDRRTEDRARNPHQHETRRRRYDPHLSCTRCSQVAAEGMSWSFGSGRPECRPYAPATRGTLTWLRFPRPARSKRLGVLDILHPPERRWRCDACLFPVSSLRAERPAFAQLRKSARGRRAFSSATTLSLPSSPR